MSLFFLLLALSPSRLLTTKTRNFFGGKNQFLGLFKLPSSLCQKNLFPIALTSSLLITIRNRIYSRHKRHQRTQAGRKEESVTLGADDRSFIYPLKRERNILISLFCKLSSTKSLPFSLTPVLVTFNEIVKRSTRYRDVPFLNYYETTQLILYNRAIFLFVAIVLKAMLNISKITMPFYS